MHGTIQGIEVERVAAFGATAICSPSFQHPEEGLFRPQHLDLGRMIQASRIEITLDSGTKIPHLRDTLFMFHDAIRTTSGNYEPENDLGKLDKCAIGCQFKVIRIGKSQGNVRIAAVIPKQIAVFCNYGIHGSL